MCLGILADYYVEYCMTIKNYNNSSEDLDIKDPEEFYYEEVKYAFALDNQMTEDKRKY